jgi:NAD(P)-dependent dehydrogenase (short-subunit alcohol dehydrogenase family)
MCWARSTVRREAVLRMSTRHGGTGGAIVNVSSAASRLGAPGQYVDYAAAKGAIDVMTIGLAKEVAAEGIRVNAVRPGLIETDIHASGGLAQPRARPGAPGADAARRHGRRSGTGHRVAAVGRSQLHHHVAGGRFRRTLMAATIYWEDMVRGTVRDWAA